eukprot:g18554.t1
MKGESSQSWKARAAIVAVWFMLAVVGQSARCTFQPYAFKKLDGTFISEAGTNYENALQQCDKNTNCFGVNFEAVTGLFTLTTGGNLVSKGSSTAYKCIIPSVTPTASPSFFVPSKSISVSPSVTPSNSITPSITPSTSITPTTTPSISITPSITPTISITPSITPSISVSPSVTPSISITPTVSLSISVTTPSISVTPSNIPSISVTPSNTPSISVTRSVSPSISVSVTSSLSVSPTSSISVSPTSSISVSPTSSISVSSTSSISVSPTSSISVSPTSSISVSSTSSISVSPSSSLSVSPSSSASVSPSKSPGANTLIGGTEQTEACETFREEVEKGFFDACKDCAAVYDLEEAQEACRNMTGCFGFTRQQAAGAAVYVLAVSDKLVDNREATAFRCSANPEIVVVPIAPDAGANKSDDEDDAKRWGVLGLVVVALLMVLVALLVASVMWGKWALQLLRGQRRSEQAKPSTAAAVAKDEEAGGGQQAEEAEGARRDSLVVEDPQEDSLVQDKDEEAGGGEHFLVEGDEEADRTRELVQTNYSQQASRNTAVERVCCVQSHLQSSLFMPPTGRSPFLHMFQRMDTFCDAVRRALQAPGPQLLVLRHRLGQGLSRPIDTVDKEVPTHLARNRRNLHRF